MIDVTVIEPQRGWWHLMPRDLWAYRELLYFMVWRDIKVRYKQSVLGITWIVIQPFVTMIVFTVLFNRILGVGTGGDVPYPVFAYAALLPWSLFAASLNRGATSLVTNRNLISRIYFPRLIIPLANVLSGVVDFAVASSALLILMLLYDILPTTSVMFLPLFLLQAIATIVGVVLLLSALNIQYRDIQYVTPFIVQIWMYATPIIYPISRVPDSWLWIYRLNPMVGVVQGFRWALFGEDHGGVDWVSVALSIALVLIGLIYFRRTERLFADVI